ncbi:NrfD/PsrC family molybdoenzyme membrane anchor subunit [Anaeromyxobacter oryzae]|uniref:NrfD n=1 Tax=Anaeromyxobacter oryzae TaxID=2918170 RepID=A0ABN6N2G3_9BACT|nr:NrfD/PsrC family molybdoenzyme membrane anchor subunit [Anaeromyxobacter oryzae]BDG06043.1 NrfD [Anaeromyxobacter oryzae]
MHELDLSRHSALVDPRLHVWGWEIPVYLFLGGMAAGVMILGAVLAGRAGERSRAARWLPFAAPVLVSVGMAALFLDLANKAHVFRFYLALRWTSPMSWGAWILVVVYPVTLLGGLAGLADDEAEALAARAGPLGDLVRRARAFALPRAAALRTWTVATGVGLGVYTGILLSTLGARALWGSALLGPLFLVSGLSTGAAFLMLFPVSPGERTALARWDLVAIGGEVLLLALFLVGLSTGGAAGRAAAELLLGGAFTAPFWALVVIAGLAVPALLEALEARLHLRSTLAAPALVLAGGLALRFILVAAGQR